MMRLFNAPPIALLFDGETLETAESQETPEARNPVAYHAFCQSLRSLYHLRLAAWSHQGPEVKGVT